LSQDEQEATKEDLRGMLTEFWIDVMQSGVAEFAEKLKASELLAKHILGEGRTLVKRRGVVRPATADILKLVKQMEDTGCEEGEAS